MVKRAGREANRSPACIAEVKNEWLCTFTALLHNDEISLFRSPSSFTTEMCYMEQMRTQNFLLGGGGGPPLKLYIIYVLFLKIVIKITS
jgi:hypothetical protein